MEKDKIQFSLHLDCSIPDGERRLAVVLVSTPTGEALFCTVDTEVKVIPLGIPAEDFMQSVMRFCGDWKSGTYHTPGVLDGYSLMFTVKVNEQTIQILGDNYFPENFDALLMFLHEECHVPVSSVEEMLAE